MKLLYVLRYYPTLTETFVREEIEELVARGHEVRIVSLGSREDGAEVPVLEGVAVLRPLRGVRLVKWMLRVLGIPWVWGEDVEVSGWKARARAVELAERIRSWGCERVHVHFAGEAAEWADVFLRVVRVPSSVTVHAVDLYKPRPSLPRLLHRFGCVVTISDANAKWLQQEYGVSATVIRCGVRPDRWAVTRGQREAGERLRVVSVGRWTAKKGLDLLLGAHQAVADKVALRLVTDPPQGAAVQGVIIGAVPHQDVPGVLAEADVFVLPCRVAEDGDRDGIPVALMEAMASGLPVVTTSLPGLGELVDEQVGWVVAPDEVGALVTALSEAQDSSERRRRGEAGARRIVEQGWTVVRQVDELLEVWGPTQS